MATVNDVADYIKNERSSSKAFAIWRRTSRLNRGRANWLERVDCGTPLFSESHRLVRLPRRDSIRLRI